MYPKAEEGLISNQPQSHVITYNNHFFLFCSSLTFANTMASMGRSFCLTWELESRAVRLVNRRGKSESMCMRGR